MRILLSVLVVVLLAGCHTSAPVSTISPKRHNSIEAKFHKKNNTPLWVSQKTKTETYYSGIGNALISSYDYISMAKREALDDLASEISVQISSNSLLYQQESRNGFVEEYKSFIVSKTDQSLENYELVDSWNDGTHYWVYYHLSKAEHLRLKNEKKQKIMNLALDYYNKAQAAMNEQQHNSAIGLYIKVLETLQDYLADDNEVIINNKSVYLANEAYTAIQHFFANCVIFGNERIEINRKKATEQNFSYPILYQYANVKHPVRNLKVNIANGTKTIATMSDVHGSVSVNGATLVTSQGSISLNIDFPSYTIDTTPVVRNLLGSMITAQKKVTVVYQPLVVYLDAQESNLGKKLSEPILKYILLDLLHAKDIRFADTPAQADVLINVTATTRKGSELNGLFSAFLDVSIAVKDKASDKEIFGGRITDIKGIKLSYEQAGMAAYAEAKNNLEDQFIEGFVKGLTK